jgi:sugar phosphate isomerase/epimerase
MNTSRRHFLKKGSAATAVIASAGILGPFATQLHAGATGRTSTEGTARSRSFGFQTWTIREKLVKDFAGTLREMAAMGYSEVEMCSPLGYSNAGFGPLEKYTGGAMKKIIGDAGLKCTSSHFNMGELRDHLENRIQWAREVGMEQMIASSFWLPKDASVDDYRKAAAELNRIGEKTKAAGLQMGFHNHHMEFEKRGEQLIYDALLEELDPDLVKMQFQVAVVNIGYQAADYFRNHPGRFISAHLADWSEEKQQQVPVGEGIIDWEDFFRAAKIGGVKNFYVEMDPETFPESADYLMQL